MFIAALGVIDLIAAALLYYSDITVVPPLLINIVIFILVIKGIFSLISLIQ